MTQDELPAGHRSGYVALAGRPNVGKSSLLNALLGESILPVSPKPQTTRKRQLGILTLERAQVMFVDTPGLHEPHHKLGQFMNHDAQIALGDADLICVIFDLSAGPTAEDRALAERLRARGVSVMVLNKVDLAGPAQLRDRWTAFESLLPEVKEILAVSALRGDNVDLLIQTLVAMLPEGPRYFEEDMLTDLYERDLAPDLIRAAAMRHLRQELPYAIAVRIDDYKDRQDEAAYIQATLFVERDSQKGIVIGKGGSMLKKIGIDARGELERMTGRSVYLELRVKVYPGWRNDEEALKRLGYSH